MTTIEYEYGVRQIKMKHIRARWFWLKVQLFGILFLMFLQFFLIIAGFREYAFLYPFVIMFWSLLFIVMMTRKTQERALEDFRMKYLLEFNPPIPRGQIHRTNVNKKSQWYVGALE